MVDGKIADEGRGPVSSLLIHVSIHMEMDRIVSHCLLAHVLQLHTRNMNCPEASLHLTTTTDQSLLQRSGCLINLINACKNNHWTQDEQLMGALKGNDSDSSVNKRHENRVTR